MGRIYTTKMALRKALITVWLTIEPESGTPAPRRGWSHRAKSTRRVGDTRLGEWRPGVLGYREARPFIT